MTLFVLPTPIGNMQDISQRVLDTMKTCDYLLAEDTRRTRRLLDHYSLKLPLQSFHLFNEHKKLDTILTHLEQGQNIGLVSDAGMPALCDPGHRLIQKVRMQNLPLSVLPGPSSVLVALIGSGFSPVPFQFVGFLPKKKGALEKALTQAAAFPGTTVAFETKHRVEKVLTLINTLYPDLKLCLARELTKVFESYTFGTANELIDGLKKKPPKGEYVLLIENS